MLSRKKYTAALVVIVLLVALGAYRHFSASLSRASNSDAGKDAFTGNSNVEQIIVVKDNYHPVDPETDNRLKGLAIAYGISPNKKTGLGIGRVGYFDRPRGIFYAWRGVIYEVEELPCVKRRYCGSGRPLDLKLPKVIEVDPLVYYLRLPSGLYAVGYCERVVPTFYQWDKVTVKENQIPPSAREKRLLTNPDRVDISVIVPPKHMLKHPKRWKIE